MKTLTLVRHAKSSWTDPSATDFERTLSPRGLRDAPEMGRRLQHRQCFPDAILCSPAARAKATALEIAQLLTGPQDNPISLEPTYEPAIYEASAGKLLEIVESTPDEVEHLMLVGHNPGMESLSALLSGGNFQAMPSGAVSQLEINCECWSDISDVCLQNITEKQADTQKDTSVDSWAGRHIFFDYPKKAYPM